MNADAHCILLYNKLQRITDFLLVLHKSNKYELKLRILPSKLRKIPIYTKLLTKKAVGNGLNYNLIE